MPRSSGLEMIKRLRAARMELPVIIASATLLVDEFFSQSWLKPAALLPKPYTRSELFLDSETFKRPCRG
jgi:DNA-binding response OmpR family regulator